MRNKAFDNDPAHHDSILPKNNGIRGRRKSDEDSDFFNQEVDLAQSILFPEGYEYLMLAIYFISIPYITGLVFIFFYIGDGKTDIFLSLSDDNSFFVTWAIGYEIVASLLLLWIAKLGISSFLHAGKKNRKQKKFYIQ